MEARPIMIGLPVVVFLAILAVFGITWMFHHHHWKPVVGGLLFVIGVAVLVMFGWAGMRFSATPVAQFAPRSVDREPLDQSSAGGDERLPAAHGQLSADHQPTEANDSSAAGDQTNSSGQKRTETAGGIVSSETGSMKPAAPPPASGVTGTTPDSLKSTPDTRPAWVDRATGLKQASKGFEATAASGLYSSRAECKRAIIQPVNDLATEYVSENVPEAAEQGLALDRDYIWSKLVKAEYWETVDKSFGTETHAMSQLHVLLAFDNQIGRDLADQARQALIGNRLKDAAGITACSLTVLGGLYLLLRRGTPQRANVAEHAA
jgi:hypothetical protein